jgi:hypothetical protein
LYWQIQVPNAKQKINRKNAWEAAFYVQKFVPLQA